MRFLFSLRHVGYVRHFYSTLKLLGDRGHEIVLLIGGHGRDDKPLEVLLETLKAECPSLEVRPGIESHRRVERDLAWALRQWLAYLWFFEPALEDASKPRERLRVGLPAGLLEGTDAAAGNPEFRRTLQSVVGAIERMLPVPEGFTELLASERPDAVVVSPLLERGIPQVNYLRAARRLGIPTGLCVASWDNLTNKGPVLDSADLVAVWNAEQAREATDLHGIPTERVAITGAPLYDDWFGREPTTERSEFCGRVGLPPDRPYLLYVCSSGFVAPHEAEGILKWLGRVRNSGFRELAETPVLVRPYPRNPMHDDESKLRRLLAMPGVVVHPPEGRYVVDDDSFADYYDAIHHSAGVVGVNTSALIDAAFVGRGVYVHLARRYRETQEGLLHFAHLRQAGGGLIQATEAAAEHAGALARAVRGEDAVEAARRAEAFLADFIRPHGLDQPSTPNLVRALESLATETPVPSEVSAPPQEWLDRLAVELEPLFHIRKGKAIGQRRSRSRRPPSAPVDNA
jgi:hypothetical protein